MIPGWVLPLVFLWVIGAAASLFRVAIARRRARSVLADRRELSGGEAPGLLCGLLSRTGYRRSVHLTVSPSLTSPVATSREIVLPLRTLWGLDPTEKATVLAHELAHIERRDPQWVGVLRALGAVFFFQPLNGLAVRRFTETAEFACDDRALELTGDRLGLARSLERVGRWVDAARHPVPGTAMVRRREATLVRRVERALNPSNHGCSGALRTALVAAMLVVPTIALPRVVAESPSPKMVHIVEEAVFLGDRGGPGRYDGPDAALPDPDRSAPDPISEL